jgi:DNA-binding GntR family transcriptional regulator
MTDEQVDDVRAALEALEAVAQAHDSPRFWELHRGFHWALLEPGATAWVQRVLEQAWTASQRYVRLFVSETVDDAMADHRELYECCERRDGAHARGVLRRHLDRTESAVRRAFPPADAC